MLYFSHKDGIFKRKAGATGSAVRMAAGCRLPRRRLRREGSAPCPAGNPHASPPRSQPAQLLLPAKPSLDASLSSSRASVLMTDPVAHRDIFIQKRDGTGKTSCGNRGGCSLAKADQATAWLQQFRALTASLPRLSSRAESRVRPNASLTRAPRVSVC